MIRVEDQASALSFLLQPPNTNYEEKTYKIKPKSEPKLNFVIPKAI